MQYFQSEI